MEACESIGAHEPNAETVLQIRHVTVKLNLFQSSVELCAAVFGAQQNDLTIHT